MESGRVLLGKLKKQNDLKTSYIRRIAVVDQIYQQVVLWVAVNHSPIARNQYDPAGNLEALYIIILCTYRQ